MNASVTLYTKDKQELSDFLSEYYSKKINLKNSTEWKSQYKNPVELVEIVSTFIDNKEKYKSTKMLVSIDLGVYINIEEKNYNSFIKYLFERFPY